MKPLSVIGASCFLLFLNAGGFAQTMFRNPVIAGDFAEPTILRVGDVYYAAGSSFEWAPYLPIYRSNDLINWDYVSASFTTKPKWARGYFHAPELFAKDGRLLLFYTARRALDGMSCIGVASADAIENGFQDHGAIIETKKQASDPFVFEDNTGLYIAWKSFATQTQPGEILCSRLAPNGLKLMGEPFTLLSDTADVGMDAPCIYQKNGYYYLFYSTGVCCGDFSNYSMSVARSKNLTGPFENYSDNPILHGGKGSEVLSCGHSTITETADGRTFLLYNAYLANEGYYNGRQAFLQNIGFSGDWPSVDGGNAVNNVSPFGAEQRPIEAFEDFFTGDSLNPQWSWNATFAEPIIRLGSNLLLTGASSPGNRNGTALCVIAKSTDYIIETDAYDQSGIVHGLTLYGNPQNLVIWGKDEDLLVLKQVENGSEQILFRLGVNGHIHLKIAVEAGCKTSYFWSRDNKTWEQVPPNILPSPQMILTPRSSAFRPGIIVTGDEKTAASFSYFRMTFPD